MVIIPNHLVMAKEQFFSKLAQTQFLPGGLLEEYAPVSSSVLQRQFVEAIQYIRTHYDLQGAHSVDDDEEDTWPQHVTAYMDYVECHESQVGNQTKQKQRLMAVQRSIIGQQPPLRRTVQHPCPDVRANTRHSHSINDIGEGTEVQVNQHPNEQNIAARRHHAMPPHHQQQHVGDQHAHRRQQQRQNVNASHAALRIQSISAITAPLLVQITMLNNRLTMSLAGSQLRNVSVIMQDIQTVLRQRHDSRRHETQLKNKYWMSNYISCKNN